MRDDVDRFYPHNVKPGTVAFDHDGHLFVVLDSHYNYNRDGWVLVAEGSGRSVPFRLNEYVTVIV